MLEVIARRKPEVLQYFVDETTRFYDSRAYRGGGSDHYFAGNCVFDASASPMISPQLLHTFPIISDQVNARELAVVLRELERQLAAGHRSGAVVEFGCYIGTTSLFVRRLLDHSGAVAEFRVYDSFEGLPEKTAHDASAAGDQFRPGELHATKKQFLRHFKKAHLTPPMIHKGWFSQITLASVPDSIFFAFLDGDYFESISDSLRLITPKLAPGAVIVVDDYTNEALPGAARAVDMWLRTQPQARLRVEASLAIIAV